jgi:hypothetical protein
MRQTPGGGWQAVENMADVPPNTQTEQPHVCLHRLQLDILENILRVSHLPDSAVLLGFHSDRGRMESFLRGQLFSELGDGLAKGDKHMQ